MNTAFFDGLIDDFGIWEHTDGEKALPEEGYALDDAARGLILCLLLENYDQAEVLFDYVAASFRGGRLYGFAHADRRFWGAPTSNDATGQVVWAMGFALNVGYRTEEAAQLMARAKRMVKKAEYLRGPAYALLGAVYTDHAYANELADNLKARFVEKNERFVTADWPWPEEYLKYANGIVPYALLRYAIEAGDEEAGELGLKVLRFIDEACRLNGRVEPVGNDGWYAEAAERPAVFSQQPIDAAYMVWAMMAAQVFTGDDELMARAREWLGWFEGKNITGKPVYDRRTNKCFDGIDDETRVSAHSGAEANICWLLTQWVWEHRRLF